MFSYIGQYLFHLYKAIQVYTRSVFLPFYLNFEDVDLRLRSVPTGVQRVHEPCREPAAGTESVPPDCTEGD